MDEKISKYIERFQNAFVTTFKKLGPEMSQQTEAQFGLTGPQFFILQFVSHQGSCKVTQIAEKMKVKPSAITVMIDRLVNHGFVERRQDPNDRRVVMIQPTKEGKEVLTKVQEIRKNVTGKYFAQMSREKLENLIAGFEALADIIESQDKADK